MAEWRSGSRAGQSVALVVLVVGVAATLVLSWQEYDAMPMAAYVVWLLVGMLFLRFVPMVVLTAWTLAAAAIAAGHAHGFDGAGAGSAPVLVLAAALVLYHASKQSSGLPGSLGEAMFVDLRDRLQAQGRVPPLPEGWASQSAMLPAYGASYAGDFLVADLDADRRHLEMVLVDVCGKGVDAAPQALQFAGALGGLIGSVPPADLLRAANDFLLRRFPEESFATAVHVRVDLRDGRYRIASAGHPPALRWDREVGEWQVDNARGTALGVTERLEVHASEGVLEPGEALMFYTDGVVESREADIDAGIDWLRRVGREAIAEGFPGAAHRIVRRVTRGEDDRAVLILNRSGISP
jgi:hypothetical protein